MSNDILKHETLIRQWFDSGNFQNVRLEIKDTSGNIPTDDYFVVKELTFEPNRLDQLWLQFYFAEGGAVGIGLENTSRISKRIGLPLSQRLVFVRGCEPLEIDPEKLIELLHAASSAAFNLRLLILPVFGLIAGDLEAIRPRESSSWNFLEYRYGNGLSKIFPDYFKKELKYEVWD